MIQNQQQLSSSMQQNKINLQYEDQNHQKDYSSIENLIKLPKLRKVQPHQNLFPPVEKQLQNSDLVSKELKTTMIDMRNKLRQEFQTYDNPYNFTFSFPESKFPPVQPGKRNLITYAQKNIVQEEDTFRDRLSPEQIQQIRQNGQFKVRSNQQYITLPYVWKVNDSLFRGRTNVELAWFKTLSKAHSVFYNALIRVKEEIPKELAKIKHIPSRLFSLFLGRSSMKVNYDINYHQQIAKDFWNEVMEKYYTKSKQWGSDLFEYLDTGYKAQDFITLQLAQQDQYADDYHESLKQYQKQYDKQTKSKQKYNQRVQQKNDKKQKIMQISNQFQRTWSKNKKKILTEISNAQAQKQQSQEQNQSRNESEQLINKKKQQLNEEELLEKLNDKKFQYYTEYLQKKLPKVDVPMGVIEAIITVLTLMQISAKKQRNFQKKKTFEKNKIQQKIKSEHKIKQYDYLWYSKEVDRLYEPVLKKLNQQYYNKYVDYQLIKKLSMKQKEVYNLWLEYRVTYDSRIQAKKKQIQPVLEPKRIFYTTYPLLPPYKVIKRKSGNYSWYEMIKQGNMQITTEKNCWKLQLYMMRVKSWSINCLVALLYFCWRGPFGLRCLYGSTEFKHNQNINSQTGQIINETRKPVIAVFLTVLEGMKKSRAHFQALPDRGLFGKNFSRYFNYAECYIFRLLFVGIILTLILYPIAIVFFSLISFLLILTVWAWMPLILLVTYLFNTILFQFESSWVPYGFWIRAAPLLSVIISLITNLVRIIFLVFSLVVIAPVAGFFICFFAGLSRGFRTITDAIMLFLIRKLGRTPSRNTAIAKKISGPGMSKQYYMSIHEQDVYILVQSELQQILMSHFNRIFNQKINQPITKFSQVMKLLLNPLQPAANYNNYNNYNYNYYPQNNGQKDPNPIYQSVNVLRNRYQIQYNNYMARYPSRPYNIRFTQEQIDSYFDNTVSIVKNFVEKKEIKSWIFEQYQILQDYDELTRKIWMTIFSCGEEIFEPLQKIDQRFKLEDMYKNDYDYQNSTSYGNASMRRNVHKVMQALQGQVQLKSRRANVGHFKHTLLNKQLSNGLIFELFSYLDNNSQGRVIWQKQNPKFLYYPNLCIKQIIKKDAHEYQWRKQASIAKNK